MTCGKICRKLDQFLSKELSEAELQEIKSHLAGCAACRSEAASLKQWKQLIRTAGKRFWIKAQSIHQLTNLLEAAGRR